MKTDETRFYDWLNGSASDEERRLWEMVEDCEEYFEDMTFVPGSSTHQLIKVQAKVQDEWLDDVMNLPDVLAYFSPTWFLYKVEKIDNGVGGYYNHQDQILCVTPDNLNRRTVLHEMIHMHEDVINELPMYFHDMVYWALYSDLRKRIVNLDDIISGHAHLLTGSSIYYTGGLHDILFLLKSFDLDIRMGEPLGTVFGYGRTDDFKDCTYQ